jgi:predicted metalloprotease
MGASKTEPRIRLALALLLACCAVIAAGCGSSNSSSSQTAAATTAATTTTGATDAGTLEGDVLSELPTVPEPTGAPPTLSGTSITDERAYLRAVFNDAQALWEREFSTANQQYARAKLTLFTQAVQSGCGAQADVGPFYCGANHGIYLDLGFFQLLAQRFGIGGFAQAYIVGHEFGHHVQNLLGIQQRVAAADEADPSGKNARSVRVELQADCLAGVWAHSVYKRGELTDEDINQALKAAAVIGDDFQTRMAGHTVDSTLWTHGSSAQRQHWLKTGFEKGEPGACDTFSQTTP